MREDYRSMMPEAMKERRLLEIESQINQLRRHKDVGSEMEHDLKELEKAFEKLEADFKAHNGHVQGLGKVKERLSRLELRCHHFDIDMRHHPTSTAVNINIKRSLNTHEGEMHSDRTAEPEPEKNDKCKMHVGPGGATLHCDEFMEGVSRGSIMTYPGRGYLYFLKAKEGQARPKMKGCPFCLTSFHPERKEG